MVISSFGDKKEDLLRALLASEEGLFNQLCKERLIQVYLFKHSDWILLDQHRFAFDKQPDMEVDYYLTGANTTAVRLGIYTEIEY